VSISQKPTHDHRLSAGEPAQQIRGRPTRRIGPTLRIPGVLGDSFHLPDRIRSTRCSATLRMMTMASLMVMSVVVWKSPDGLAGGALGGHAGAVMVILS